MKTRMFLLAALVAAVMLGSLSQAAFAKHGSGGGGGNKTRITLTAAGAYPRAKGTATYKAKGSEREFQAEVENIKKLAGKQVNIFVNGAQVGSATVNGLGAARLNLNTNLGNAVPNIQAGAVVQVKTSTGTLIATGSF